MADIEAKCGEFCPGWGSDILFIVKGPRFAVEIINLKQVREGLKSGVDPIPHP